MSKIDDLIEEFCPEGVPSPRVGDLGSLYSGLSGKSKIDFQDGNATYVSYLDIGNNPALPSVLMSKVRVNEKERQNSISKGDLLFTGSSEDREGVGLTSEVEFDPSERVYLNSFCFGWRPNSGIFVQGFLKHLFRSYELRRDIMRCANGVTRINISKKGLLEIRIPVPPLEVQREIVSILDKFTQLEAELEAELEARRIQYEVTREMLLDFSGDLEGHPLGSLMKARGAGLVPSLPVSEIATIKIGEFVKKTRQDPNAPYPVFNGGTTQTGFFENYNSPENSIVISARGSIGFVNFLRSKFWAGNSCYVLRPKGDSVQTKYLYHSLKAKEGDLYALRAVGGIPALNLAPVRDFQVSVPSIEVQTEIVSTLDKLDALVNDINFGLPAEIAARRKQYEYYRNKLLTFKEFEAA